MLFGYGAFALWYVVWVVSWFMGLPAVERTGEVMGFVTGSITAVMGGGTWYASSYNNSGRKWTEHKG